MSCNFLVKFDGDEKYKHLIIPGCNNATPSQAVLKYFQSTYSTVTVSNFDIEVLNLNANTYVWCKYIKGVSICEEKYEIFIGINNVMKDSTLGQVKDNFIQVKQIIFRVLFISNV